MGTAARVTCRDRPVRSSFLPTRASPAPGWSSAWARPVGAGAAPRVLVQTLAAGAVQGIALKRLVLLGRGHAHVADQNYRSFPLNPETKQSRSRYTLFCIAGGVWTPQPLEGTIIKSKRWYCLLDFVNTKGRIVPPFRALLSDVRQLHDPQRLADPGTSAIHCRAGFFRSLSNRKRGRSRCPSLSGADGSAVHVDDSRETSLEEDDGSWVVGQSYWFCHAALWWPTQDRSAWGTDTGPR